MRISVSRLMLGAGVISVFFMAGSADVSAAPATAAEAQRIQGEFETYLGKGGGSGASPVTVSPAGEDYTLSINLQALARPLSAVGFALETAPLTMTISPRSDGLWRVVQSGMPEVQVKIKEQTIKMRIEGLRFDGVYDPKLMAFVSAKSAQAATHVDSAAPGVMNIRRDGPTNMELTGTGSADGSVSAVMKGITQSHSQSFRITQGSSDTTIAFSTEAINTSVTIDSMRMARLAAIWAFVVANASQPDFQDRIGDIKQLVRAALPLFNAIAQNSTIDAVAVSSPVGNFAIKQVGLALNLTGIRKEGDFGMKLAFSGLSLPPAILPPWSGPLLPDDLVIDFKANGYDLEIAANMLLDAIKPGAAPADSEAAGRNAVFAAFPDGKVKVALGPSRVVSKLLTLTFDGDMTVIKPIPRGKLTMRAKGIDETIAHLQKAGAGDQTATQALMVLIGAKGFGKADADGSLVWVIENPDGGMPTINGVAIPGLGGK